MSEDLKSRLGGIVLLLIGAAIAWWGVWRPLEQARAGAREISWPLKVVVIVPVAIVFGLYLLVAGARFPYRDAEKRTLTPVGWSLFAIVAIAALGSYLWMQSTLTAMGYR